MSEYVKPDDPADSDDAESERAFDTQLGEVADALRAFATYRKHLHICHVESTDFCTCGMLQAFNRANAEFAKLRVLAAHRSQQKGADNERAI